MRMWPRVGCDGTWGGVGGVSCGALSMQLAERTHDTKQSKYYGAGVATVAAQQQRWAHVLRGVAKQAPSLQPRLGLPARQTPSYKRLHHTACKRSLLRHTITRSHHTLPHTLTSTACTSCAVPLSSSSPACCPFPPSSSPTALLPGLVLCGWVRGRSCTTSSPWS